MPSHTDIFGLYQFSFTNSLLSFQLQSRSRVGPIRRRRMFVVVQLLFLQQEAQANCFLHLQSDQVSITSNAPSHRRSHDRRRR